MTRIGIFIIVAMCGLAVGVVEAQKPKPKTRIEREKENTEAWEKLSYAQKRWLVYSREIKNPERINIQNGWMGLCDIKAGKVIQVMPPTDLLIQRPVVLGSGIVWVTGMDVTGIVDGAQFEPPSAAFWVPRTKAHESAGETSTVLLMEFIPDADKIKAIVPPKTAKLADFPPK